MKKVLGMLLLSCICILLGLSVKWSREQKVSLISSEKKVDNAVEML